MIGNGIKSLFGRGNQLLIAITLVLVVLAFSNQIVEQSEKRQEKKDEVMEQVTPTRTKSGSVQGMVDQEIKEKDVSKILKQATLTPHDTPLENVLDMFVYPGSSVLTQELDSMTLESSDTPTEITTWYREKIQEYNMRATSFIQTNTQGNIENKLVGSSSTDSISVEITKRNNEIQSVIKIVRMSS